MKPVAMLMAVVALVAVPMAGQQRVGEHRYLISNEYAGSVGLRLGLEESAFLCHVLGYTHFKQMAEPVSSVRDYEFSGVQIPSRSTTLDISCLDSAEESAYDISAILGPMKPKRRDRGVRKMRKRMELRTEADEQIRRRLEVAEEGR